MKYIWVFFTCSCSWNFEQWLQLFACCCWRNNGRSRTRHCSPCSNCNSKFYRCIRSR